jgi:hypothetical protein
MGVGDSLLANQNRIIGPHRITEITNRRPRENREERSKKR